MLAAIARRGPRLVAFPNEGVVCKHCHCAAQQIEYNAEQGVLHDSGEIL
jgi:hypothetical protein